MKAVKIKKTDLNKGSYDLLVKLGAFDDEIGAAFPSNVYMAKEDYDYLRKATQKLFKKQYSYMPNRGIAAATEWDLLGYGPNQSLQAAIRPGYVLIDWDAIHAEIKRLFELEIKMAPKKVGKNARVKSNVDRTGTARA